MIQVINRALSILELIASDSSREFRLSEIADTLDLNHGTCANILKTLIQRNYIEQSSAKKGYKLGYMAYKLCDSNQYNEELINIAKDPIDKLGENLNEAIILSIIKNDKRILLYERTSTEELQVRTTLESSVYRATTGRMILSYYSPKELDNFIERAGMPTEEDWPEVKTKEDLIYQLNIIHNNNIEIYNNKNHVIGLATPIFKNNKIIASLGIYLPDARYRQAEKKLLPILLKKTTDIINKKIILHNKHI
ncbi:MAG: helix-turn-helix domain-containing protein [Prevotella sp.]|jgi:DNA-binding IclR family transcriptional regulator|nr:helix-turn-helix domain-containing protein [Prevotella sp.]